MASKAERAFIKKLQQSKSATNPCVQISDALQSNSLTLEDKKRCCLLVNLFPLSKFAHEAPWVTLNGHVTTKPQWFHSASAIFVLLSGIVSKPTLSFVDAIYTSHTEKDFLAMAREVLSSESDGVEFLTHFASSQTCTNFFIDPHNNTVLRTG